MVASAGAPELRRKSGEFRKLSHNGSHPRFANTNNDNVEFNIVSLGGASLRG